VISTQEAKIYSVVLEVFSFNLGRYLNLDELERGSRLSRHELKDALKHLSEAGFDIQESSKGHALFSLPDSISPIMLYTGLKCRVMGSEIHGYKTVASTNETARRLAEAGAPEGTIVISEKQTRGRGRLGRTWHSVSGQGLYFSIILRPRVDFSRLPALPMIAGLSVCRAIECFGLKPEIKWPNDCLLDGKKVAGILVELSAELDRVEYAVLGVGINVNQRASDFPSGLRSTATSIYGISGYKISRADLCRKFLHDFEKAYNTFQRYGFRLMAPEIIKRSAVIGKKVTLLIGRKKLSGIALGFDVDGALRLKDKDGVKVFSAGEISLR
jgi:BirA family transcriptional regulator, biotin operon repressor / biotin---[acetyl-CoA-carboxylase] ligase